MPAWACLAFIYILAFTTSAGESTSYFWSVFRGWDKSELRLFFESSTSKHFTVQIGIPIYPTAALLTQLPSHTQHRRDWRTPNMMFLRKPRYLAQSWYFFLSGPNGWCKDLQRNTDGWFQPRESPEAQRWTWCSLQNRVLKEERHSVLRSQRQRQPSSLLPGKSNGVKGVKWDSSASHIRQKA